MNPNYVARISKCASLTILRVLFIWLIIPVILIIIDCVVSSHETYEFYDDKVIHKSGVFSKHEETILLSGVLDISVSQSVGGRMFNYGDVMVNLVGEAGLWVQGVVEPAKLKEYLSKYTVDPKSIHYTAIR